MNPRSFTVVMVAALAATVLLGLSFLVAQRCGTNRNGAATDELAWLRTEFRLSDAELARIRTLHEGYLPRCAEMCRDIAAKKREVEAVLAAGTNLVSVETKLMELGGLRARCQAQMLQHFAEVSQAMPPEQGRRYRAEMQRLTLGFHEQIEQSMSHDGEHEHGHH
jgi:hypothetical protein